MCLLQAVVASNVAVQKAPEGMSYYALSLLDALLIHKSSSTRAVPTLELLADVLTVPQFYQFFQVRVLAFSYKPGSRVSMVNGRITCVVSAEAIEIAAGALQEGHRCTLPIH